MKYIIILNPKRHCYIPQNQPSTQLNIALNYLSVLKTED